MNDVAVAKRPDPNGVDDLDASLIWLDSVDAYPAVVLFRRRFNLSDDVRRASMKIFAEAVYTLWINGSWVGRGPTHHHPHRLPVRTYDVGPFLQKGANALAVLVHAPGEPFHHYVPSGRPGLLVDMSIGLADGNHLRITTDGEWRGTAESGWRPETPRRSWATSHIEVYDAAKAPQDWQAADYDDSGWSTPTVHASALPAPDACFIREDLPPLAMQFVPAQRLLHFAEISGPPVDVRRDFAHGTYGNAVMQTDPRTPSHVRLCGWLDGRGGGLRLEGLSPGAGAMLEFDLGAEWTGHGFLRVRSGSAGVIDFGWGERLDGGRVAVLQKGTSYVDQIHVGAGVSIWRPYQYNAGRYLAVLLRGFTGDVSIERVGWEATTPNLPWDGARFNCEENILNRVFDVGVRTISVGTQESLMDCPTRERATYIGDGLPTAYWIALLTGDTRHWRYLTREMFLRASAEGLLRSTPFSGRRDTLLDYSLLAVVWTALYQRYTGDRELVREVLPGCRGVLGYFDRLADNRDLFAWHWPGQPSPGDWEPHHITGGFYFDDRVNLFIDHPGMGWHNVGEPGIDRRGVNAAINFLRLRAMTAMAELEESVGDAEAATALRDRVKALVPTLRRSFFDPGRGMFVDGELNGKPLPQISQQTNTWALWSGGVASDAFNLARRVLHADPASAAQNGPYFWTYLYPVLCELGLFREGLDATRSLYGNMMEPDTTTLWETWKGDDLDSRCHPWSAAVVQFLLCGVAGLPSGLSGDRQRRLRPQPSLMNSVESSVCLPEGRYEIGWRRIGENVELWGSTPEGTEAALCGAGGDIALVRGRWTMRCDMTNFRECDPRGEAGQTT